jgi:hypothetical protein
LHTRTVRERLGRGHPIDLVRLCRWCPCRIAHLPRQRAHLARRSGRRSGPDPPLLRDPVLRPLIPSGPARLPIPSGPGSTISGDRGDRCRSASAIDPGATRPAGCPTMFGHGTAELRRPVRVVGEQPVLGEVTQVGEECGADVVGRRWGDAVRPAPSEEALPQQPGDPVARPAVRGVDSGRIGAAVDDHCEGVPVDRPTLGERPDGHVPTVGAEVVADRDGVGPADGAGCAAMCHAGMVPAGCDSQPNTRSPAPPDRTSPGSRTPLRAGPAQRPGSRRAGPAAARQPRPPAPGVGGPG